MSFGFFSASTYEMLPYNPSGDNESDSTGDEHFNSMANSYYVREPGLS